MFVRRWWKRKSFRFWTVTLIILGIIIGVHVLIFFAYQAWTGVKQPVRNPASSGPQEWLFGWLPWPLLITLVALVVATTLLYTAISKATQKTSLEQQREDIFQQYLDRLSELLLAERLRSSAPDAEVRKVARAQTLTVLGQLDAKRQSAVLSFLREAKLVTANAGESIVAFSQAHMAGMNLSSVDLHAVDLSNVNLSGANLSRANLREANLSGANLSGADLSEAHLLEAHLKGANLSRNPCEEDSRAANLSGAVLYRADLSGANLSGANLSGAYLGGANLLGADLRRATLRDANMFRANLSEANLSEANLLRADLRRATLRDADLSGADLSGAYLDETNFSAARLTNVRGLPPEFVATLSLHAAQQIGDGDAALPSKEISGSSTDQ
ncbi:MAG TPA: pentapeptide repeat-containing protein [Ktedonobacteraceae bacterium]|nr:pentapeptide repeat-containing protein [Ktedonobacteraceae bacterium]